MASKSEASRRDTVSRGISRGETVPDDSRRPDSQAAKEPPLHHEFNKAWGIPLALRAEEPSHLASGGTFRARRRQMQLLLSLRSFSSAAFVELSLLAACGGHPRDPGADASESYTCEGNPPPVCLPSCGSDQYVTGDTCPAGNVCCATVTKEAGVPTAHDGGSD
jgi:hypothetical protein